MAGLRRPRILSELYAKLIGLVLMQFVMAPYRDCEYELSPVKVLHLFQHYVPQLLVKLCHLPRLTETLGLIALEDKVYFPHSLGIFYQALTQYLGFHNYGDEYKVMGLAPYGSPKYLGPMREIVHLDQDGSFSLDLEYFRHHNEKIDYEWEKGEPTVGALFSEALVQLLGPLRGG